MEKGILEKRRETEEERRSGEKIVKKQMRQQREICIYQCNSETTSTPLFCVCSVRMSTLLDSRDSSILELFLVALCCYTIT
ncbi:hypothetical protein OFB61_23560, partial [Escherichia coli]|nr:hypothetical protein [Escherichia coli]